MGGSSGSPDVSDDTGSPDSRAPGTRERVHSLLGYYEVADELVLEEERLRRLDIRLAGLHAAALATVLMGVLTSKLVFLVLIFLIQFMLPLYEKRKKLSARVDELRGRLGDRRLGDGVGDGEEWSGA